MNRKQIFEKAKAEMIKAAEALNAEAEEVRQSNALSVICNKCGNMQLVIAAVAIPESDGTFTLVFGSDADFCNDCGTPDVKVEGKIICA